MVEGETMEMEGMVVGLMMMIMIITLGMGSRSSHDRFGSCHTGLLRQRHRERVIGDSRDATEGKHVEGGLMVGDRWIRLMRGGRRRRQEEEMKKLRFVKGLKRKGRESRGGCWKWVRE